MKSDQPMSGVGTGKETGKEDDARTGDSVPDRDSVLKEALDLLENVTPLRRDCGRLCNARCCRSLEGEDTGMLLFPGEEARYRDLPGWRLQETSRGILAQCPGTCDRSRRPLACRLFPALPEETVGGKCRVRMDERARAVCPLARQGTEGLAPEFTEAVRRAGEALMANPEHAAALRALGREQEELRTLRQRFGAV